MHFTEDEIMLMKVGLVQYMNIKLDNVNIYEIDLKKIMLENGIDINNESNKIIASLAEKIEATEIEENYRMR